MSADNPLREGLDEARTAEPAAIVIFGASGDLTQRKLLPALFRLLGQGLLPGSTRIVGVARRDWDDDAFRSEVHDSLQEADALEDTRWEAFSDRVSFVGGDFREDATYTRLAEHLGELARADDRPARTLFYLAVPPPVYGTITAGLAKAGLGGEPDDGWTRVVVEKPFGHDRESARELDAALHAVYDEDQVFRIDHYLGKETVQNILVFRLENGIFEPLWNQRHVDHVQITVAESLGVGSRAGFYEGVGVLRDMLQNHLMQLLTLVAMDPPARFSAKDVRDEKVKVLRSIRPLDPERDVVRGRYGRGVVDGREVPGYLEEEGVADDSDTETFLAARFHVDSWRWSGTPFYLRSGKRLPRRATEIAIVFKRPPVLLFGDRAGHARPNVLTLRIQPREGISLSIGSKLPGQDLRVEDVRMDFLYATSFGGETPEAYERLLLDAVLGESTLFAREDEVDLAWGLVDPVAAAWKASGDVPETYAAGTWGPACADELIARDGRAWVRP